MYKKHENTFRKDTLHVFIFIKRLCLLFTELLVDNIKKQKQSEGEKKNDKID